MDYKLIIKDSYKRLPEMRLAVTNLRRRAAREKSRAQSLQANRTDTIKVQQSRSTTDNILDCIATADICEQQADYIAAEIDELNNALLSLPDTERITIEQMIINGNPADDVCDLVHLERRSVYNYLDRAIEQLARSLWGAVIS